MARVVKRRRKRSTAPAMLSVSAAAERLDVPVRKLRQWLLRGWIAGGYVLVAEVAVRDVERRRQDAREAHLDRKFARLVARRTPRRKPLK
jgi:hypothetical protein